MRILAEHSTMTGAEEVEYATLPKPQGFTRRCSSSSAEELGVSRKNSRSVVDASLGTRHSVPALSGLRGAGPRNSGPSFLTGEEIYQPRLIFVNGFSSDRSSRPGDVRGSTWLKDGKRALNVMDSFDLLYNETRAIELAELWRHHTLFEIPGLWSPLFLFGGFSLFFFFLAEGLAERVAVSTLPENA